MTQLSDPPTETADTATVRAATPQDSEFLAWVMLSASRSQLPRGIWEHLLGWDEPKVLDYLAELSQRGPEHLFHWSRFLVAEVEGQPAAALSGYDPQQHGFEVYLPIAIDLYLEAAGKDANLDALMERGNALRSAMPPDSTGAWVVESVATAPTFRRRGLADRLLDEIIEQGRSAGHLTAQISVFIGNDTARAAYQKHGFQPAGETRTPQWEAAMNCPGIERLLLDL